MTDLKQMSDFASGRSLPCTRTVFRDSMSVGKSGPLVEPAGLSFEEMRILKKCGERFWRRIPAELLAPMHTRMTELSGYAVDIELVWLFWRNYDIRKGQPL